MIYAILLNSFRIHWIKFLNRNEKAKTFFYGIFIFVAVILSIKDGQADMATYNIIARNFFINSSVFILIYFSFSILVILLHLPTAGFIDRKVKELSSLQHLSRFMLGVFEIEKVLKIIIDQTIEITGAKYCWLIVKNPDKNRFELMAQENLPLTLMDLFIEEPNQEIVQWIEENKNVLMIDRISKDSRTANIGVWKNHAGSLLGIPLLSGEQVMGMLFAVKNIDYGFLADDRVLLSMFANNAAIAIENSRLVKESLEKEKYEQELKIAHEAQMKLLPTRMPEVANLNVEAICITANEVGGDYYDFINFKSNKLGVIVGDVSGKGAEAAFYMAEAKGIIESLSKVYLSPRKLLIEANKILFHALDKRTFISLLYGIFDFNKQIFHFCRAGHCPLIYWSVKEEEIFLIEPPGLALGLDEGDNFEKILVEEKIKYRNGDLLIFYTDGVTEARNQEQEEFEEERLCDVIVENCQKDAVGIKNAVLEKIKEFVGDQSQHDDLTMVILKPE